MGNRNLQMPACSAQSGLSMNMYYRTVKNFGGQKVWRKGILQGIGEKNFGEKVCRFRALINYK